MRPAIANRPFTIISAVALIGAGLIGAGLFTGCGGSSSKSSSPANGAGALSGNWQVSLTNTSASTPVVSTESGFLVQSGKQLNGTLTFQSKTCSGAGVATGTADGSAVALNVNQPGLGIQLTGDTGTASVDGTGAAVCSTGNGSSGRSCLMGNYALLASGCGNSETGTWSAFHIASLSGTMNGALTQNSTGVTSPASVTLQQGTNSGGASAQVTGTLTPGIGASACIPSGQVSGQVSGNSVILAVVAGPDNTIGTIKGQIQGVWLPLGNGVLTEPMLDFTAKTSSYNFSVFKKCNLQSGADPDCLTPDLNNPECVVDPACTPDPLDPPKCPGPTNPKCTGVKLSNCEAGKGTLCQSGAC